MKEYIKLFNNLQSADGYVINDIPFTCTAISGDGTGNINLRCNEEDKKLEVAGDTIEIVDNGIPNDEIWYTSTDGNIVTPYSVNSLPTIVSNTYSGGKGVMTFASDVTSIGDYAFSGRTNMTSISIPNSITTVGQKAFLNCNKLTTINIPYSVMAIGAGAFYNCASLSTVHITDLSAWCNISFKDSRSNPVYYAHHLFLNGSEITNLQIPSEITTIKSSVFADCYGITSVDIHSGVTTIEDYAFSNCRYLPSIAIPGNVKTIGKNAFDICLALSSVTFSDGITSIDDYAFGQCSAIPSVRIPNSVTNLSTNAFWEGYCFGTREGALREIIVGDTSYEIGIYDMSVTVTLGNGTNVTLRISEVD